VIRVRWNFMLASLFGVNTSKVLDWWTKVFLVLLAQGILAQ